MKQILKINHLNRVSHKLILAKSFKKNKSNKLKWTIIIKTKIMILAKVFTNKSILLFKRLLFKIIILKIKMNLKWKLKYQKYQRTI